MADISRRGFLQSMTAAFSAAALGVRFDVAHHAPPKIRYDLFTCPHTSRWDLSQPWSHEGSIAATDAKKLIVHPGEWSGAGDARVPNIGKLMWEEFDKPGWKELPRQIITESKKEAYMWNSCAACMGLGRCGANVSRCPHCGGDGEYWDDSKEELLDGCGKCFGGWIGGTECRDCKGSGNSNAPQWLNEIHGGFPFCPAECNKLRTLGGLDFRVIDWSKWEASRDTQGLMLFRGDGGLKGFLCGVAR